MSKIASKGTVKPKVRLIKSCNNGLSVMKGFNCLGTEVTNVKTNLLTNDDSQIVVAKGITTNKPAIRSFFRSCWSLDPKLESWFWLDSTKINFLTILTLLII